MNYTSSRVRGAVLIVVLGVLSVLALLATTFAILQGTERQITRNYLDMVRAKLLAQSGIEDAATRLSDPSFLAPQSSGTAGSAPLAWKFWGLDPTETVDPNVETQGPDALKLERAVNPSFAFEDETPQNPGDLNVRPKTITVDGRIVGVSGFHESGTYANHGDYYALKVNDLSGRIHVNDGLDGGPTGAVTQNTKRILNTLGLDNDVNVPTLGDMLINNRPPTGYQTQEELLKAVNNDAAAYSRFKDFVTVRAWVDKNVCNPVPLSAAEAKRVEDVTKVHYYRGTPAVYRLGFSLDAVGDMNSILPEPKCYFQGTGSPGLDNPAIAVWGLDVLNPLGIEIVSRAPVCVNTAPKPVLVALLTDLKGFYLTDRRRCQPSYEYSWMPLIHWQNNYRPGNIPKGFDSGGKDASKSEGDEMGFLYETFPIIGPGSTGNGISAPYIADEIIACRNKKKSPHGVTGIPDAKLDYATAWFGGPFYTWRQFNAFVDNLILIRLIEDRRENIFLEYEYADPKDTKDILGARGFGNGLKDEPSPFLQKNYAARAIASVIKANFNPNLHLNETNPDQNLFQIVDKTDLLVNSTEFCFVPTGYFEVESLGRVLRPESGTDSLTASNNKIVAQAKISAIYRLFDVYRETNQSQFAKGAFKNASHQAGTNNGKTLEAGPEPDNGRAPLENEWGGYIALPTMGGNYHDKVSPDCFKGDPRVTCKLTSPKEVQPEPIFGATWHGHLTWDFDLHHSDQTLNDMHPATRELASSPNAEADQWEDDVSNIADLLPDKSQTAYPGPYGPGRNNGDETGLANRHRLARSFRRPAGSTSTSFPDVYAPSDLRIDGAYSERNCGLAYATTWEGLNNRMWDAEDETAQGSVAFWYKPAFNPELTGKVRSPWDFARYHTPCRHDGPYYAYAPPKHENVLGQPSSFFNPFSLWFVPAHLPKGESIALDANWTKRPDIPLEQISAFKTEYNTPGFPLQRNHPVHRYAGDPYWLATDTVNSPVRNHLVAAFRETYNPPLFLADTTGEERDYMAQFRPASFVWGAYAIHGLGAWVDVHMYEGVPAEYQQYVPAPPWYNSYFYGGCGRSTDSLNHVGHADEPYWRNRGTKHDVLEGHHWVHVAFTWSLLQDGEHDSQEPGQLFINGVRIGNPCPDNTRSNTNLFMQYFDRHDSLHDRGDSEPRDAGDERDNYKDDKPEGSWNTMRFGNPSTFMADTFPTPHLGNHSADGTVDEIYLWASEQKQNVANLWSQGRYFHPMMTGNNPDDVVFTALPFSLAASADSRVLAPPDSLGGVPPSGLPTTTSAVSAVRIVGVAWTWYAEDVNPTTARPTLLDYSKGEWIAGTDEEITPYVSVGFMVGASQYWPDKIEEEEDEDDRGFWKDISGFWTPKDSEENPLIVDPSQLRYMVRFKIPAATGSILLATPVFDDVTIYWSDGPKVLSYVFETRAM